MTPSTRKSSQASGGIRHAARRQRDGHHEAEEVGGTIGRKLANRGITTAAGTGEAIGMARQMATLLRKAKALLGRTGEAR